MCRLSRRPPTPHPLMPPRPDVLPTGCPRRPCTAFAGRRFPRLRIDARVTSSILAPAGGRVRRRSPTRRRRDSALEDIPFPGGRPPSSAEVELGRRSSSTPGSPRPIRLMRDLSPARSRIRRPSSILGRCRGNPLEATYAARPEPGMGRARCSGMDAPRHSKSRRWRRIRNPEEMGLPGDKAAAKLTKLPEYKAHSSKVRFLRGTMKLIAKSIASFERTLVSKDSAFDRYRRRATLQRWNRPPCAARKLFFGRAKCSTCHGGPNFTDGLFHNTGVMSEDQGRARSIALANSRCGRTVFPDEERLQDPRSA